MQIHMQHHLSQAEPNHAVLQPALTPGQRHGCAQDDLKHFVCQAVPYKAAQQPVLHPGLCLLILIIVDMQKMQLVLRLYFLILLIFFLLNLL